MSLVRKKPLQRSTKRMRQRHRACGAPTKAEQLHQDAQRAHGCAMCWLLGLSFKGLLEGVSPCGVTRVHHRTTGDLHGNLQLGQSDTVALGDWHHDGILKYEFPTVSGMLAQYGPSLKLQKRAFLAFIAEKLGERSTAALQAWQDEQIAKRVAA